MAIFDKPFSFSEMLRRTIFKGRPNFFNAKDFNKELLILHNFIEEFNRVTLVQSNVVFNIPSFSETNNAGNNTYTRNMTLNWSAGVIMYKGIKFQVAAGGQEYEQTYADLGVATSPKKVKPLTYVILTATLATVTYGDNPTLCGIQSDEIPNTVPTVDVEQYTNIELVVTEDPSTFVDIICVLGTLHPRYSETGDQLGYGFLYHTLDSADIEYDNGYDNKKSIFKSNDTLFEYLLGRVTTKLDKVLNERQLVRRFDLADISDFSKSRKNVGFSKLVNHKQLVQDENLRDLTEPARARWNLGLGNSAVRHVGYGHLNVAPGNVLPVGLIAMWSGSSTNIPTGWVLCNGEDSEGLTPNLVGKFVVGYDPTQTEFSPLGQIGGSKSVLLTNQMIPKHNFSFEAETDVDGSHRHLIASDNSNNGDNFSVFRGGSSARNGNGLTVSDGDHGDTSYPSKHKHHITGETDYYGGDSEGNAVKVPILPPYYALCFIMFLGIEMPAPEPLEPAEPLVYPNFSEPDTTSDGGYSTYVAKGIGTSGGKTVGSGIIITNPE